MVTPLLVLVLLGVWLAEGTKITSYLVRQGSGCTGAVLLNTPMTPSGVCIRTPTFSYKLTCGLYEQWDNFGCNGTANLNSHDYNECASPPTENFSYQYVCEDMVAPVQLTLQKGNCPSPSSYDNPMVLDVGVCRPLNNRSLAMPMDESFKVTKSGTAYVLSHYKSNNMCQGAPFQYPAVEANTCNYDPSQLEWQSLVVAEIANDGTVPGTSSPATGSTTTSAPATGNTATRSPKTSSGTGLVAGQTVLGLVFAALAL